jgi:hypothetical protein
MGNGGKSGRLQVDTGKAANNELHLVPNCQGGEVEQRKLSQSSPLALRVRQTVIIFGIRGSSRATITHGSIVSMATALPQHTHEAVARHRDPCRLSLKCEDVCMRRSFSSLTLQKLCLLTGTVLF